MDLYGQGGGVAMVIIPPSINKTKKGNGLGKIVGINDSLRTQVALK